MGTLQNDPSAFLPLTPVVFAILLALSEGEKHGYAIMKGAGLEKGGAVRMGAGTLYGSLDRLMKAKLVEETGTTDNERRRYYRITEFGQRVFEAEVARLESALNSVKARFRPPNAEGKKPVMREA